MAPERIERLLGTPEFVVAQDNLGARHERRHPPLVGAVEAEREEVELALARGHAVLPGGSVAMHGERAVLDGDGLGGAGRAGGVDQVGELLSQDRRQHIRQHHVAVLGVLHLEHGHSSPHASAQALRRQQQPHARTVGHLGNAGSRQRRIDRQERRAGLEHREQPHDHRGRAIDDHANHGLGAANLRSQCAREAPGAAL
ncbi:hypothetical protein LMG26296_05633 [Cupriavidus plantarum]|nr:hypothetical protein LMG26296_05633 [Cupriavidus plantarum]